MSTNLVNLRLEKTQADYQVQMRDFRVAVLNFLLFLEKVYPKYPLEREVNLPRGYVFVCKIRKRKSVLRKGPKEKPTVLLANGHLDHSDLLKFAEDVCEGWLNDLAVFLEGKNRDLKVAAGQINTMLAHEDS